MINYLLINILLTTAALTINQWLNMPHRIRFYTLMVAVIAWLLPFGLIHIEISQNSAAMLPVKIIEFTQPVISENQIKEQPFDYFALVVIFFLIGLVMFIRDLISSHNFIKNLKPNSTLLNLNQNIRVSKEINGAFVSGYSKPIIWISHRYLDQNSLKTIIAHEQQHIKSKDQYWLIVITFVQRLMWFNPLIYLLCEKTRQAIELGCDEACKNQLGQKTYQTHLAEIILDNRKPNVMLLHNTINHHKNFNINRIEQLNQEYSMNYMNKIKLGFITTALLILCLYSITTTADNNNHSGLNENEDILNINWKITKTKKEKPHKTEIKTNIEVNKIDYQTFNIADYKFKIKAQLANSGSEPKAYLINTQIFNNTNTAISEPAIMVIAGETGTIRMVDSESKDSVKPQIELSFTVLNNSTNSSEISAVNLIPIVPTPPNVRIPMTAPEVTTAVNPPVPPTPISAPNPEMPENVAKPVNPAEPPETPIRQ